MSLTDLISVTSKLFLSGEWLKTFLLETGSEELAY
jgi:hypothetical protein